MPETSTIKRFVQALETGRTDTTKALDRLMASPGKRAANRANLEVRDALKRPLAGWMRDELTSEGLSPGELAHIDDWPDEQKEQVRAAVLNGIQSDRGVLFFWELHSGPSEATDVQDSGAGDIRITFRSPRSKVRVSAVTYGDIAVDVG